MVEGLEPLPRVLVPKVERALWVEEEGRVRTCDSREPVSRRLGGAVRAGGGEGAEGAQVEPGRAVGEGVEDPFALCGASRGRPALQQRHKLGSVDCPVVIGAG